LTTTILAFLFVLGVLVFVHELGHFLAARRIGVRVLTFSLGFGPKLLKTQRGDTEYCISAFPLGGYVKMAGESPDDNRSGAPDEFLSKTKWQRFQVLIMGPVANLVLAVLVLAVVLAQGAEVPIYQDQPAVVGKVVEDSPAETASIQAGDRIIKVADDTIESWMDLEFSVSTRPRREIPITYVRDGAEMTTRVTTKAEGRFEMGDIGVLPYSVPVVRSLASGEPAALAGVKPGDVIVAVNGESVPGPEDLKPLIIKNADREIELTIRRDGQEQRLSMRAAPQPDGPPRIGLTPGPETKMVKLGPIEALSESVEKNWESSALIFRTIGELFTGETSVKQLQGPVGIGILSGEAAQAGWISLLTLMSIISLNLGILNLLPVPILDGGHILIMALEGIARRDFSIQAKEKMLLAGFVVLMMLMVTVIYNDLTRISSVERLMPWRN
jgi:regulator of sigma E protease